jgi:coenzyme F420-reducing hydrogenase delta subunit
MTYFLKNTNQGGLLTKMKNLSLPVTLFYCSNSLSAEEIQYCNSKIDNVLLKTISLPCSGKVNLLYLLKAIETGAEGVMLVTCNTGECKYLQGNIRAKKRIEAVDDLLDETGYGRGCIKCVHLQDEHKLDILVNEINAFIKQLRTKPQLFSEKV